MNVAVAYFILLAAAVLEAGGDALVRGGLHGSNFYMRVGLLAAGAATLFAYGLLVNTPPWEFGKLLGVYVSLFFLVTQILGYVVFGVRPSLPIIIGGAMILVGGLVITFW